VFAIYSGVFFLLFRRVLARRDVFSLRVATIVFPCLIGIGAIVFSADAFDIRRVEAFIIGDSDSKLYYDVGIEIARSTALIDQLRVWDLGYLNQVQNSLGMVFKDLGFYWIVGILFTISGPENAVPAFIVLNIAMLSQAVVWLCEMAQSERGSDRKPAFVFFVAALFYLNSSVGSAVLSCRKDIPLLFFVALCLRLFLRKKWFYGALLLVPVFFLRAAFIVPALTSLFSRRLQLFDRVSKRKLLIYSTILLVAVPWLYELLLQPILGQLDSGTDAAYSLKRDLGGSAIFLKSKFLQFLYVLLTPLLPLSLRAYEADPLSWVSLISGIGNIGLLFFFCRALLRAGRGTQQWTVLRSYFLCILILYAEFAFLTAIGVSSGLYGIIEPRYKIAVWCLELVFIVSCAQRFSHTPVRRRPLASSPEIGLSGMPS
jgi:hypothetical protein